MGTGSPILQVKNLRWDTFSDILKATSWDLNENSGPTAPASPPHTDCPLGGDQMPVFGKFQRDVVQIFTVCFPKDQLTSS